MIENETQQTGQKENKEENNYENTPHPTGRFDAITAAKEVAERIEAANKKAEELLQRQEALRTEQILSGKSPAGSEQEKPKELTPAEYKDKVVRGEFNVG